MKEKKNPGFFVRAFYTVDFTAIPDGIQFHTCKAGLELAMQLRMSLNFSLLTPYFKCWITRIK